MSAVLICDVTNGTGRQSRKLRACVWLTFGGFIALQDRDYQKEDAMAARAQSTTPVRKVPIHLQVMFLNLKINRQKVPDGNEH